MGGWRVGTTPGATPSLRPWLRPASFEYAITRGDQAALRLVAEVEERIADVSDPVLIVRQLVSRTVHRPTMSLIEERAKNGLFWTIHFELPLEILEGDQAMFALSTLGRLPVALPAPVLNSALATLLGSLPAGRPRIARTRRCLVAVGAGVAVATSTGALASAAAADTAPATVSTAPATSAPAASTPPTLTSSPATSPGAATQSAGRPSVTVTPNSTSAVVPSSPAPVVASVKSVKPSTAKTDTHVQSTTDHDRSTPTNVQAPAHSHKHHTASVGTALSITRTDAANACRRIVLPAKSSKRAHEPKPAWHNRRRSCLPEEAAPTYHHKHKHKRKHKGQEQRTHHSHALGQLQAPHHLLAHHVSGGAGLPSDHKQATHVVPATDRDSGSVSAAATGASTSVGNGFNVDPFTAQQLERFSKLDASLAQPPRFLVPIYKAAGRHFHIAWQILAAINAIETNYGNNLSISSAGAMGWMQFMPSTWRAWGIAADGDSRPNPYDPRDAIFSAARYLDAGGGMRSIRRALFAYNHAWWYVDAVLWRAQLITDHALGKRGGARGYALPLDLRYMDQLGRTDDGVDIEDAPDGVAVYSMTSGVVTAVASDPAGFGPNYPVILATRGPLAGQYIYYGHVAASLVKVGQHVLAGEPIAVMGHTGDATSLGHGHIEIGFSDASGDPLNHHGVGAWTPSGDAMHRVLIGLTTAFLSTAAERSRRSERAGAVTRLPTAFWRPLRMIGSR